jgi:hypothetical protein
MLATLALLLLQIALPTTLGGWLITILIVAGVCGVFWIIIRQTGWNPPPWLVNVFWIVVAVVVGVLAIKFLLSLR